MKIAVVDDEKNAREFLIQSILGKKDAFDFEIIEADSVLSAIKLIQNENPDIVFLDINMPGGNGFDVLDATKNVNFHVVFTTAYDQYAIKAFKYQAFHYLLKPIDIEELDEVFSELVNLRHSKSQSVIERSINDQLTSKIDFKRITIPYKTGFVYLNVSDILYFEADGSYTTLVTDDMKYVVSKKIKYFEEFLNPHEFCRIHASFIINLARLKFFSKNNGGEVTLDNGIILSVSKSRREAFLKSL